MPSIDERVVSMAFENQVFEQRVAVTMASLGKLNDAIAKTGTQSGLSNIERDANKVTLNAPMSALDKLKAKLSRSGEGAAQGFSEIEKASSKVQLDGAGRAIDKTQAKLNQLSAGSTFTDIEKAADRTELSGLTRALDNVTNRFSVLQGAASVALGNIASQAAMKGAAFAKSFAFGPAKQGFEEYQTNLGSIQTILSNTQGQQVSGLDATNKYLGELNKYSDQTIYNFSEMAKNIGTFTAAGVDLPKATASIKGIANIAAASGSSSQQAATAMYQLSQAISSGRVGLQDWNSVVNAGMGGALFQKALLRTADNMGTIEKGALKIDKATGKATVNGQSFRESIMSKPGEQSWLTSDVLTKTLEQFTGDMSNAQLKAEGFSDAQIKAIQAQAKMAKDAATQVKTLPQVFDIARETLGSGWAKTFQTIFGDFGEAKATFTALSQTINGFINTNADARNKVLDEWKKLGGRKDLLMGIKDAFENIIAVLKPIKDAFREIFPAKTGKDLAEMTKQFRELMKGLLIAPDTAENLKRTFAGFFAVLHIGWEVIKGVVGVIFDLLGALGKGSGGFLNFTGSIGDFLVSLDKTLTKGGGLKDFFAGLGTVLKTPIQLLGKAASALGSLFGVGGNQNLQERNREIERFGKVLTPAERLVNGLKDAWDRLVGAFEKTKSSLEPWFSGFMDGIKNFGQNIGDTLSNLDFDKVMAGLQTGFMAGIFIAIKKVLGKGGPVSEITDTLGGVNKLIGGFTGQMEAMQSKLKAEALLAIAGAVAVLAGGLFILSTIKGEDLQRALTAAAIGLGELIGAMKIMTGGMGKLGVLQLPVIAAGMIGLAIAVTILAGAMKIFATMSWEDIAKGMAGVAGSISAVGLAMRLMPPTLPLTAAGLILIGVALNLVAASVKIFASMKWEEIAKGLFAMVNALGGIALGVSMMPPTLPLTAAGLILLGVALGLIGGAIARMGELDFGTILKGLGTIMAALAGIGLAMSLVPPTIALTAAGIFIVANAMVVLSAAMKILGSMDLDEILKSLVAMGGALLVLGTGLIFMSGTLAGSAALLLAATALAVLAPTLAFLGNLSFGTIIKGLGAIALVLGTLSIVGLVASAGLVQLGISLLPLAVVFTVAAAGVFLFAKAMALLAGEGGKGIAVLITALTAFVAAIPSLVITFIKGLLSIVEEVVKLAPRIIEALGKILEMVIAFVVENAPKLATAITALVKAVLDVLAQNAQPLIDAGWKLIQQLLTGVSNNIGSVVTKVGEIITKFLNAFATQAPKIVQGGAKVLGSFLGGIATALPTVIASAAKVVGKFLSGVTAQLPGVIRKGATLIVTFLQGLTANIGRIQKAGVDLIVKFIDGVGNSIPRVINSGVRVIKKFMNGIATAVPELADSGAKALVKFLNGLEAAIRNNSKKIRDAGWGVVDAIVDGMLDGFRELWHKVEDKARELAEHLPGPIRKALKILSPSGVFAELGRYTIAGLAEGLSDHRPALAAVDTLGNGVIGGFKDIFQIRSPSQVLKDIGKEVGAGFKQGLEGSAPDIRNAFKSLREKIGQELQTQKDNLKQEQNNLADLHKQYSDKINEINRLRSEKKPDREAINAAVEEANELEKSINKSEKAINKYKGVIGTLRGANLSLRVGLKAEKQELISLSKQYDEVSQSLDDAKQALADATRTRDDAIKSFTDQFNQGPDMGQLLSDAMEEAGLSQEERQERLRKAREEADRKSRINQVENYKKALRAQIEATKKYQETLKRLRELGLDDTTYKKLLARGLAGQDFAEQLLATGKSGISDINKMDKDLLDASTGLATDAATSLYQAGVDAAQGLVDGLKAKQADLKKAMDVLGDAIVNRIKSVLGIRSPSKVFNEVGQSAAQGLVNGLTASSAKVASAAAGVGDNAAEALTGSLGNLSDKIGSEIDTDLTVTPVLDLSQVQKDASKMHDLTNVTPITAAASFGQASAISTESKKAAEEAARAQAAPSVKFEQNNYSPEALSDVEIYRRTSNQLAQLQRSLGLAGLNSA